MHKIDARTTSPIQIRLNLSVKLDLQGGLMYHPTALVTRGPSNDPYFSRELMLGPGANSYQPFRGAGPPY
jgi:hypothetical protein